MSFDQLFKKKVPTPEQMYTLVKYVEHGSLSAAFGRGKSAQAAATQQLGRIDQCLGIRTRKKSGSFKIPTDEAKELAGFCRIFFQNLEDFKARSEKKPNTFVMGAGDSLSFYILIPALKKTGLWCHSVEWHLENLRSREIVAGLLDGSVDVGLVRTSAIEPELIQRRRLKLERICRLEYAFFVRQDLLREYQGNSGDDNAIMKWCVQNVPLAIFWGEQSVFTTALERANLNWPTRLRCQSFPQVKEAVIAGGYCGILPRIAFAGSANNNIRSFGSNLLTGIKREIGLAWSSSLTVRRQGGETALNQLRDALKSP